MAEVTLLEKCAGLNTVTDPVRLDYDPKVGVAQLAMAVNVDVDDTGRVSRRKGYAQLRAESCHSLWTSRTGKTFYVSGGSLYQLGVAGSRVGIRSGLVPDLPMSFCEPAGQYVYYTDGISNGKILNGVSYAWTGSAYIGPTSKYRIDTTPPVGRLLEHIGGRMLIAQDSIIWYSLPFAYDWYIFSTNRVQFETTVIMMKSVETGLWVSDESGVYWLGGPDPLAWTRVKCADKPAIEGTAVVTEGWLVGKGTPGQVAIWTSEDGIFMGDSRGQLVNLSKDTVRPGKSSRGSGVVYNGRYVCILE